jgi:hypothetical protein
MPVPPFDENRDHESGPQTRRHQRTVGRRSNRGLDTAIAFFSFMVPGRWARLNQSGHHARTLPPRRYVFTNTSCDQIHRAHIVQLSDFLGCEAVNHRRRYRAVPVARPGTIKGTVTGDRRLGPALSLMVGRAHNIIVSESDSCRRPAVPGRRDDHAPPPRPRRRMITARLASW